MINLKRVAQEIKTIGLYDLVYQDAQKILQKKQIETDEIETALLLHPEILNAYKQTNLEYNISNIHLKDIDLSSLEPTCRGEAQKINANLAKLREIEKYTLDFEQSSILVIIMSIEFFVLFSVQYFIVLLNLKAWQWEIYGLFALSVLGAWLYAKKERAKFELNSKRYETLYMQTLEMIETLEKQGYIQKKNLFIEQSGNEHI
ncbi:MAG: hypothetical protein PHN38_08905 [Sulfurospirillaceae bacterium]|nr:hypothetical protein [Sulfurospirillaceae bacterium]MDD3462820.1 hypothetical protein [Sulfurospirillaceae bacterium]